MNENIILIKFYTYELFKKVENVYANKECGIHTKNNNFIYKVTSIKYTKSISVGLNIQKLPKGILIEIFRFDMLILIKIYNLRVFLR